jgi:hypothetical protein
VVKRGEGIFESAFCYLHIGRHSYAGQPVEGKRLVTDGPDTAGNGYAGQAEFDAGLPCPMDHTPNAVTIAAMEEGDAILRGEIPAALTLDLSGYKTREEQLAAMRAAFDAVELDDDEDED